MPQPLEKHLYRLILEIRGESRRTVVSNVWREAHASVMHEEIVCANMKELNTAPDVKTEWFAIKTKQDFRAEKALACLCEEVLFPKETVRVGGAKDRVKAIIPHVLFVKTTKSKALELEKAGREHPELSVPFWIYRYPKDNEIQVISQSAIHLLRLLTADDTTHCEVFNKADFNTGQQVIITGGDFEGYTGRVVRVKKNKHVVVQIEGICLILLPFIHPDFLQPLN